jgi:outer membrane autotransporter protein
MTSQSSVPSTKYLTFLELGTNTVKLINYISDFYNVGSVINSSTNFIFDQLELKVLVDTTNNKNGNILLNKIDPIGNSVSLTVGDSFDIDMSDNTSNITTLDTNGYIAVSAINDATLELPFALDGVVTPITKGDQNALVSWNFRYDSTAQTVTIIPTIQTVSQSSGGGGGGSSSIVEQIDGSIASLVATGEVTQTTQIGNDIGIAIGGGNSIGDITTRMENVNIQSHQVQEIVLNNVTLPTFNALRDLTIPTFVSEQGGVASGDEKDRYGFWMNSFANFSKQGMHSNNVGYRSKQYGGILGTTTKANDSLSLGVAFSKIKTILKFKNWKLGDKANIDTNAASVYAVKEFGTNWSFSSMLSAGRSTVKNLEHRIEGRNINLVQGKSKSDIYSLDTGLGYGFKLSNRWTFAPTMGLRYTQIDDKGYSENGARFQNFKVSKKHTKTFEGILDLTFITNYNVKNHEISQDFYLVTEYLLHHNKPKLSIMAEGFTAPVLLKSPKPQKVFYNLGTSMSANFNKLDTSIGYDLYLAKKYICHEASLNLKLSF